MFLLCLSKAKKKNQQLTKIDGFKIYCYNFSVFCNPMANTKKTSTEDAQKEMKKESKGVTIKTN